MTMTRTKSLILAGLTVISLGAGHAMAEGTGIGMPDYWAQQYRAAASLAAADASHGRPSGTTDPVQAGAADLERPRPAIHFDSPQTAGGGG
jgi:hypothetical protein